LFPLQAAVAVLTTSSTSTVAGPGPGGAFLTHREVNVPQLCRPREELAFLGLLFVWGGVTPRNPGATQEQQRCSPSCKGVALQSQ
ncbi:hypothetical protein E2320_018037, partial [Naja naja]